MNPARAASGVSSLTTTAFDDVAGRARAFGVIGGLAGVGAAAGPLIGGLITTGITRRAADQMKFSAAA